MFSAPEKNIEALALSPNEIVADLGAGSGAYTFAAARALRGTGKVYAVEVQKELLGRLEKAATAEHLGNIGYIWGDIEKPGGTKLRDGSCDAVIISNVLFQAPDKKMVVDEARRILKHGGRLLIIDWTGSFNNMGPTPDAVFPELEARRLAESLNFTFDKAVPAGNFHYGLLFRKGMYFGTPGEVTSRP